MDVTILGTEQLGRMPDARHVHSVGCQAAHQEGSRTTALPFRSLRRIQQKARHLRWKTQICLQEPTHGLFSF